MPSSVAQLKEIWKRLKTSQRIVVACAPVAVIALIVALVVYGSQPEYGVLFSDLKPADAQTIIEKLKAANVPYQLSNGGTTVSVPAERVSELRLQMAASGAISGGHVGFDIFDKNSFGATDFAQQVNYQRALEGELARTLEGMDEVEAARVHITRPHESLFTEKSERAKASVVLRTRQNHELSRERTSAVINLIASAVEGLDPADVAVMDARGRLLSSLSDSRESGESGAFNSHLEARRKFEAETAQRVVSLLEPITGAGHVRADVAADLDFSRIEQTEEKFDPKSAVVRSQQTSQEARNATLPAAGGVAGVRAIDPNAKPSPAANATNTTNGDQRMATTTNYEIDRTVTKTVGGNGRINRLSVSVVADYKTANGANVARSSEELQKMQELVAAAVGIDEKRGDKVVVQTIPFEQKPLEDKAAASFFERNRDLLRTALKYAMLAFVALLIIFFVVRPARRALKEATAAQIVAEDEASALGRRAAEARALPASTEAANLEKILVTPRTVAELEAEMNRELESASTNAMRADVIRRQILERSRQNPEEIAHVLRGWLQNQTS
jgi:flagellar M-ring protein FliF